MAGSSRELKLQIDWLKDQPAKHKIAIAGNHDFCLEQEPFARFMFGQSITYLQDSSTTVEGLRIWGSPWTMRFGDWAFGKTEEQLEALYSAVPPCDILITHGPPFGILDQMIRGGGVFRPNIGSRSTLALVERLKPKLHVFGHIHEAHGSVVCDGTTFINAAYCNHDDTGPKAANDVIEVEL